MLQTKDKSKTESDAVIDQISEILSKVKQIYDYIIVFIQNDLSYIEKFQKFLSNSYNALEFSQQPDTSKLSEQQKSVFLVVSLYNEFKDYSSLFSPNIYDQFKTIIAQSTKKSQDFDTFCKATIRAIRTAFSNFHTLREPSQNSASFLTSQAFFSSIQKSSDLPSINIDPSSHPKNIPQNSLHMMYRNIHNTISTSELNIFKELDNIDIYINSVVEDENQLLGSITKKLNKVFVFNDVPATIRSFPEKQTISYFKLKLIKKFFKLKSFSGSRLFSPPKPIGSSSSEKTKPFYARVWKNYENKAKEELSVKKKEIVLVIRLLPDYWYVIKPNKEQGYVPIDILEPLEESF